MIVLLATLLVVSVKAHGGLVEGLYCGEENCYDVLGIQPDATDKEVKKAYKGFAKDLHPDRFNKLDLTDEEKVEVEDRFTRIATAYENLKGEERVEYDDFLANPDKYYYQYYQYYRRSLVAPIIDLRLLIILVGVTVSAVQWVGWSNNYQNALQHMYMVDKYRMAAKREAEERGEIGNKKANRGKTQMEVKAEEKRCIMAIIEEKVDIRGGFQKPDWKDLCSVQMFYVPYYLSCWAWFHVRWYYKFTLMKQPFGEDEKLILIRKHLNPPSNVQWEEMLDKNQDEFITRGLWIKSHADEYLEEQAEREREEKAGSTKWKQYRRFMKSEGSKQTISFDE